MTDRGKHQAADFAAPAHTYIPALDGMRAISVLLVLIAHAGLGNIIPGGFGVTVFFFISGYLITSQLMDEEKRTKKIDFGNFYLRRALRLLPAAFVYIAVAGAFFIFVGGSISIGGFLATFFYGADFYEVFHAYYSPMPDIPHPFNTMWSLAIEEQFYLIWPLTFLLLVRRGKVLWALVAVCLFCLVWRAILYPDCYAAHPRAICGVEPAWRLYKSFDTRIDSLAYGAIVALLTLGRQAPRFHRFIRRLDVQFLAVGLLLLSLLIRNDAFREVARHSVQGLALCVLVPVAIFEERGWIILPMKRWLSAYPAVFVGRLSYPLYLWHWGTFGFAAWLLPHSQHGQIILWAVLTATFALASWFGIERPILRLRRRMGSHMPLYVTVADTPMAEPASAR